MGKKDKILKQMQGNPKNVDFNKLKKLLENSGYECINTGDSHFVFRKDNCPSITIPFKRPIKIIYVKKVLKILENSND
jgi:predicted RNA binding protein YcfA (HicA-like mRNA interferase family)